MYISPKNSGDFKADSFSLGKKQRMHEEKEIIVKYKTGIKKSKGINSLTEDIEKL